MNKNCFQDNIVVFVVMKIPFARVAMYLFVLSDKLLQANDKNMRYTLSGNIHSA